MFNKFTDYGTKNLELYRVGRQGKRVCNRTFARLSRSFLLDLIGGLLLQAREEAGGLGIRGGVLRGGRLDLLVGGSGGSGCGEQHAAVALELLVDRLVLLAQLLAGRARALLGPRQQLLVLHAGLLGLVRGLGGTAGAFAVVRSHLLLCHQGGLLAVFLLEHLWLTINDQKKLHTSRQKNGTLPVRVRAERWRPGPK